MLFPVSASEQTTQRTIIYALLLRIGLLMYGVWHDGHFEGNYTDIDYQVYTDAAEHVLRGGSPYDRYTYRYSPLLAYLMVPNLLIHHTFGKLLFVAMDIYTAIMIRRLVLHLMKGSFSTRADDRESIARLSSSVFLFNPLIFNISTRGSADILVSFLVILMLHLLFKRRIVLGAAVFGFAVHFKIYPILYAVSFLSYYGCTDKASRFRFNINRDVLTISLVGAGTFLALLGIFYYIYGFVFLYETYLHHLMRKDNRHNFSVYFYHLYLSFHSNVSSYTSLIAFLPQVILTLLVGVLLPLNRNKKGLVAAIVLQTYLFVTFNKVVTAQYFLWYHALLPLLAPMIHFSGYKAMALAVVWQVIELGWAVWGSMLEMGGKNVFFQMWVSNIAFFWVNVYIITEIIQQLDVYSKSYH